VPLHAGRRAPLRPADTLSVSFHVIGQSVDDLLLAA
jgi:hypothetical protein